MEMRLGEICSAYRQQLIKNKRGYEKIKKRILTKPYKIIREQLWRNTAAKDFAFLLDIQRGISDYLKSR
ncbi:MAG: hypothetical protein Q8L27_00645 [archaeon]|nr:hypothetical protein [archaeon]